MAFPIGAALATAAIPSVVNGVSQLFTNKSNLQNYNSAQGRANQFARQERLATQAYNSLENQFGQMARVGMNPNLLTGLAFQSSSPVSNQPVSPPQNVAPQLPSESLSQAALNAASAQNQHENAVTVRDMRGGYIRQQNADYEFTVANTSNTRAMLPNIQKQTEQIQAEIDRIIQSTIESDARTQNVREETGKLREQKGTWKRLAEKQIDELISRISVNGAQRSMLMANREQLLQLAEQIRWSNKLTGRTFPALVSLKYGERDEQRVRINTSNLNNKFFSFKLGLLQNYGELDKALQTGSAALQVVNQLIELSPYERAKKDIKDFLPFSNNSPSTAPLDNNFGSGGFESSYGW